MAVADLHQKLPLATNLMQVYFVYFYIHAQIQHS
jgi:hypothetical protein